MSEKELYDYGHLFKRDGYSSEDTARYVLKQTDKLAAVHKLAMQEIEKIQRTGDLTAQGKVAKFRALGTDTKAKLEPLENVVTAYGNRIREVQDGMTPKPHDRNDLAWQLELREIRDHVRGLDPVEREMFVMAAVERGDQRVLEAVQFAPVPFTFVTQKMIDKMIAVRAAAQYPEQAIKLRDMQRAEGEVQGALASVRANLARQGLKTGGDALTVADAA